MSDAPELEVESLFTRAPEPDVDESGPTEYERLRARRMLVEKMRRTREVLALYRPMPSQEEFHKSRANERVLRGSNQAGKTMCAAIEVAWAALNRHPYYQYPESGLIIAVGKDEAHLADTMWKKLSKPQPKVRRLKDPETGQWRLWMGEHDPVPFSQTECAGPILPERFISDIIWTKRGRGVPALVKLKTGWEIMFRTAAGKPPQGLQANIAWFDEEILDTDWYNELNARLVALNGRLFWSATPQAGGDQLWQLHLRAEEYVGHPNPRVEEFALLLDKNQYLGAEEKDILKEKYKHDPDSYRVRILGEYLITSFRVYPTFHKTTHMIEPFPIPDDWARYMIVDPGNTVCAVLFVAVPPDGKHRFVYRELYIKDCTTRIFGEKVKDTTEGEFFQAFIIDKHGSIRTDANTGTTLNEEYTEELERRRVVSKETASGFHFGKTNWKAGVNAVLEWLHPVDHCTCKWCEEHGESPCLMVFNHCTNFEHEIQSYHKRRLHGVVIDEPVKKDDHLMDCTRYAAMHGCPYVKPAKRFRTWVMDRLAQKRAKRKAQQSKSVLIGAGKPA